MPVGYWFELSCVDRADDELRTEEIVP